jgi:Raf kinase inhibitor-like YbhB/YbcL family protein
MNLLILFIAAVISQATLTVKSSAFANGNYIPQKYTCAGENYNPEIEVENIPSGAKSLALIMDDTESPNGEFVHWVMWNISVKGKIAEKSAPGVQGKNSRKENKYYGPCPPNGIHKYHFKIYALDKDLDLPASTDKAALLKAMEGHILASGELLGQYK